MENMITMLSRLGNVYVDDLVLRSRSKDAEGWDELFLTAIPQEDIDWLYERVCCKDNFKYYLANLRTWHDMSETFHRMCEIGREMEGAATGEYWENFTNLEDLGFLVSEVGTTMLSLLDLNEIVDPDGEEYQWDWVVNIVLENM